MGTLPQWSLLNQDLPLPSGADLTTRVSFHVSLHVQITWAAETDLL